MLLVLYNKDDSLILVLFVARNQIQLHVPV